MINRLRLFNVNLNNTNNPFLLKARRLGSKPLTEDEHPEVYQIVEKLTSNAKLPMPKLYITPSPQPNAFATGRNPNHSAVAVTEGLLTILNREELEGVLGP